MQDLENMVLPLFMFDFPTFKYYIKLSIRSEENYRTVENHWCVCSVCLSVCCNGVELMKLQIGGIILKGMLRKMARQSRPNSSGSS
jgi:hypothetical protein